MQAVSTRTIEVLPEWEAFAAAVEARRPDSGTWCEAWTVRDIVIHQTGNAEELARVLAEHLAGRAVPTRTFEDREAQYRDLSDAEAWAALRRRVDELAEVAYTAADHDPDEEVAWTGRTMRIRWFAEHMRSELVLHRWDITGDDAAARADLAEAWMTDHSVHAVGRPLLARGSAALKSATDPIEGRLRVAGTDDVLVRADGSGTHIELVPVDGPATLETDAAARALMLWGRRTAEPGRWRSDVGPEELRRVRSLLAGY